MVSFHRLATSWLLTPAINIYATSKCFFSQLQKLSFFLLLLCDSLVFIRFEKIEGKEFSINDADYIVFHSPYNKVIS